MSKTVQIRSFPLFETRFTLIFFVQKILLFSFSEAQVTCLQFAIKAVAIHQSLVSSHRLITSSSLLDIIRKFQISELETKITALNDKKQPVTVIMPALTRSASRRALLEEARATSANTSTVSAPAASATSTNTPAVNAPAVNDPAVNAPAVNAPAANASTDGAPTLGETAPLGLMAPANTRRRSEASGQFVAGLSQADASSDGMTARRGHSLRPVTGQFVPGLPQAGSSSNSAPQRTRRGSSPRPRAAHGRHGASSTIFDSPQPDDERGIVEVRNRSEEGPFTLRNQSFAENQGANGLQDQEHPEQDQPNVVDANDHQALEDHGNRHQRRRIGLREWVRQGPRQHVVQEQVQPVNPGRRVGLREWARQGLRHRVEQEQGQPINVDQSQEELDEVPRPTLTSVWRPPVTELPPGENIGLTVEEPLEQGGNEAGEAMEWMEVTNAVEAARRENESGSEEQRMLVDPCTSPTCPLKSNIPHDRGLYLHNGKLNPDRQFQPWGLSNPPPMIWRMARRLEAGTAQPGDFEATSSFVRNHGVVLNAHSH